MLKNVTVPNDKKVNNCRHLKLSYMQALCGGCSLTELLLLFDWYNVSCNSACVSLSF